jgi:hypothetical protein
MARNPSDAQRVVARQDSALRAPRAAAIAGIIFSVLLITSLVLIRLSVPRDPLDPDSFIAGNARAVELALNLIPFSGIAFLWFIGVVRDRIGASEDRLFATVFLGSGLLFLAMLFASAAVAGGLILLYADAPGALAGSPVYLFGRVTAYEITNIYTVKMAGVFMVSTSTLALRTGILPRWMTFLGLALAIILLLSIGFVDWILIVFPLWVLMISIYILIANMGRAQAAPAVKPAGVGE